jgi:hypothetical protein
MFGMGAMALTPEQRAGLEALGPEVVRQRYFLRGDVEDWLAEKEGLPVQRSTLQWAKIAEWAGVVGIGAIAIAAATMLVK